MAVAEDRLEDMTDEEGDTPARAKARVQSAEFDPLASFAEVFTLLRHQSALNRPGKRLDVDRIVSELSRCREIHRFPRLDRRTWGSQIHVIVDLARRLIPYRRDQEMIAALGSSETIPVVLPGCSYFLGSKPAPARKMIDAGLPLALATDCNPGSCMIESLPLIMSIAATMLRMTPLECLVACTANAAAALRRADRLGAIAIGHQADLLILDIPNVNRWVYQVGVNPVLKVIKAGRVVVDHPGTA